MEQESLLSCPKGLPNFSESDINSQGGRGGRRMDTVSREHLTVLADASGGALVFPHHLSFCFPLLTLLLFLQVSTRTFFFFPPRNTSFLQIDGFCLDA